jgi:nucleotide-binding universal stress UspA family protein
MYQTILVPLDGSHRAEKILAYVEELAQPFGAHIFLLQVVELSPVGALAEAADTMAFVGMIEEQTRKARTYLAGIQNRLHGKGIHTETLVEYGPAVATILEVAERVNADLIAMSSHGRTGLARVFYGSVAIGVLHRVDRPLLLIRAQEPVQKTSPE